MLNVIIIDDEENAIGLLEELLKSFNTLSIKIVGTATNLNVGIELIKNKQPDIVFLDINMPGQNGLDIHKEFTSPKFKIIYVTGHPEYALDAFRNSATDYILKPVSIVDLKTTLQKVSSVITKEQHYFELEEKINMLFAPSSEGKNIILEIENGFIMENSNNIEYCYASQSYSVIVTYAKKEILVTKSLRELEDLLPANRFYRTHRSYLVNIHYIRKFMHSKENYVLLQSGTKIQVSVRVSSVIVKDIKRMLSA
jgi:two-component system LytT family response regulator